MPLYKLVQFYHPETDQIRVCLYDIETQEIMALFEQPPDGWDVHLNHLFYEWQSMKPMIAQMKALARQGISPSDVIDQYMSKMALEGVAEDVINKINADFKSKQEKGE